MFKIHAFRHPAARFSPAYFWVIEGPMVIDDMLEQLRDMVKVGARSVCLEPLPHEFCETSRMSPAYLSEEYFAVIREVVREAKRLGMNYYLYDEGGYPSGSACGRVWAADPEHFTRSYARITAPGEFQILREETHPEQEAVVPDILAKGATQKFIELTHQAYFNHLGQDYFGKTIRYAFTDEPSCLQWCPPSMGWTEDLSQEFLRRKGYALEPYVARLAGNCIPLPGSDLARAAIDYREVVSQLFVERYLLPLRDWCRKHHMLSGGHFNGEDEWFHYENMGFGNILQSLRALDLPGVDMIWRQLYPGERLHPFPKLASSAAHQNGTRPVLGELYAAYGSGLKPQVMKFLLDYMLVCGVNTFVFSNRSQLLRDGGMSGCRPHFGPVNPLWKYFRQWHDYVSRMSQLMNQGHAEAETALYLDLRAMSLCEAAQEYAVSRIVKISDFLLESQSDFDYIDDEMLRTAKIRKGKLVIGKARYSRLVVPPGSLLTEEAKKRLKLVRKAGIPVYQGDEPEAAVPVVQVFPPTRALRLTKRILGNNQIGCFMLNTSSRTLAVRLQIPEKKPIAFADAENGELYAVDSKDGCWEWTFQPWESRYFLFGAEPSSEKPPTPGAVLRKLNGAWRLRPILRYFPGEHEYQTEECHVAETKTTLGDWRSVLGTDFSGDAVYSLSFSWKGSQEALFLDLGQVNYAAEVRLNGKKLGCRLLAPFVFPLQGMLRHGINRLEITVTNTLANIVNSRHVQEYWEAHFWISPYEDRQEFFEKESLVSGLFGPVTIRTAADRK